MSRYVEDKNLADLKKKGDEILLAQLRINLIMSSNAPSFTLCFIVDSIYVFHRRRII